FFLSCSDTPRNLHYFPTRRSSDLGRTRTNIATGIHGPHTDIAGNAFEQPHQPSLFAGGVRQPRVGRVDAQHPLALTIRRIEAGRSEEHTSELQSRENLVCRLLLEK